MDRHVSKGVLDPKRLSKTEGGEIKACLKCSTEQKQMMYICFGSALRSRFSGKKSDNEYYFGICIGVPSDGVFMTCATCSEKKMD
ncbi:uncharacterized protein LOC144821482 isoform X3 [Lissotriton helveticus]